MREITITEGLVELKLLDKRINDATKKDWVAAGRRVSSEVNHMKKDDFIKQVKADYESVNALIKNRAAIKSAIVKSNAETVVEVAGERMTVAEAIERKTSIEYDKALLNSLKRDYADAKDAVVGMDAQIEAAIDKMSVSLAGSEKKDLGDEQIKLMKAYREANEWAIVDPLGIEKEINALAERIDSFEANVDTALSLSNAVTKITVQ